MKTAAIHRQSDSKAETLMLGHFFIFFFNSEEVFGYILSLHISTLQHVDLGVQVTFLSSFVFLVGVGGGGKSGGAAKTISPQGS